MYKRIVAVGKACLIIKLTVQQQMTFLGRPRDYLCARQPVINDVMR